jgi:hypothetical protein
MFSNIYEEEKEVSDSFSSISDEESIGSKLDNLIGHKTLEEKVQKYLPPP